MRYNRVVQKPQFSIRTLLLTTTALAIWMWVIGTVPVEASWPGQIFRIGMLCVLCSFTAGFHAAFRYQRITWAGAALWAGVLLLQMLVFLAFEQNDWSILQPWILSHSMQFSDEGSRIL